MHYMHILRGGGYYECCLKKKLKKPLTKELMQNSLQPHCSNNKTDKPNHKAVSQFAVFFPMRTHSQVQIQTAFSTKTQVFQSTRSLANIGRSIHVHPLLQLTLHFLGFHLFYTLKSKNICTHVNTCYNGIYISITILNNTLQKQTFVHFSLNLCQQYSMHATKY